MTKIKLDLEQKIKETEKKLGARGHAIVDTGKIDPYYILPLFRKALEKMSSAYQIVVKEDSKNGGGQICFYKK